MAPKDTVLQHHKLQCCGRSVQLKDLGSARIESKTTIVIILGFKLFLGTSVCSIGIARGSNSVRGEVVSGKGIKSVQYLLLFW